MKQMLLTAICLLLCVNRSNANRLINGFESKSLKTERRRLIQTSFNDKICVTDNHIFQLSGEYEYTGNMVNNKPSYKMTKCTWASGDCWPDSFIQSDSNGKWTFYANSAPFWPEPIKGGCHDTSETPQQCNNWWYDAKQITECGNIVTAENGLTQEEHDQNQVAEGPIILTQSQKDEILKQYNDYRSTVALGKAQSNFGLLPMAAKMVPYVWDNVLADESQNCANQCAGHCPGGNEGIGGAWDTTVAGFYNELTGESWKWGTVCVNGYCPAGHFWGVIRDVQTSVGCGYAKCLNNDGGSYFHFVCRYGGGYTQDYPYTPSTDYPGSLCPHGANPTTGLCYL